MNVREYTIDTYEGKPSSIQWPHRSDAYWIHHEPLCGWHDWIMILEKISWQTRKRSWPCP